MIWSLHLALDLALRMCDRCDVVFAGLGYWLTHRPWRALVKGLPAIVTALVFLSILGSRSLEHSPPAQVAPSPRPLSESLNRALASESAGPPEAARAAWRELAGAAEERLVQRPDRTHLRLLAAVAWSRCDEPPRATALLRDGLARDPPSTDRELLAIGLVDLMSRDDAWSYPAEDRDRLLHELLDAARHSPRVAERLFGQPPPLRVVFYKSSTDGG